MELTTDQQAADLADVLLALQEQEVVVLLGAGASSPQVPLARELPRRVANRFEGFGAFSCKGHDPWVVRFLGDETWRSTASNMAGSTASWLIQEQLALAARAKRMPQYDIFNALPGSRSFVTMNLDGLVRQRIHKRSLTSELHGRCDVRFISDSHFEFFMEAMICGWRGPKSKCHIYGPEPPSLVEGSPYRNAASRLRRAKAVVIIGYSFGRTPFGLDDEQSFEWFVYQLKRSASAVFVVDPNPWELAAAIEGRLRQKRVSPLAVNWSVLAAACLSNHHGEETLIVSPDLICDYNWRLERAA